MVGITPDGKRILEFDHDHTRKHSPIIHQMEKVFIKENKSIYQYMLQLREMGENPKNITAYGITRKGKLSRASSVQLPGCRIQDNRDIQ